MEEWTEADKRDMVAEIMKLVYARNDGPPPTCEEDDPGWIVPEDLPEPESLDDPAFIRMESCHFLRKEETSTNVAKMPSAQDLFDVVNFTDRGLPWLRFRTARLMNQKSIPDIERGMALTYQAVKNWDTGAKPIPEKRIAALAIELMVKPKFLAHGSQQSPSWLQPWGRAVRGLAFAARWMVAADMPIPGIKPGPPGPGNGFAHITRPGKPGVLVPRHRIDSRDLTPVVLATSFLWRFEDYRRKISVDERQTWFAQYADTLRYLPFLPYVWGRMGELVYLGDSPRRS